MPAGHAHSNLTHVRHVLRARCWCVAGARPAAAIALLRELLALWDTYHRWLELVVARCGPLGARVESARQLLGHGSVRRSTAANIPHLLNKGLLQFRSQVCMCVHASACVCMCVHASACECMRVHVCACECMCVHGVGVRIGTSSLGL